jgi:phage shock protein PspC (stress-responsive transcriptional regulator)
MRLIKYAIEKSAFGVCSYLGDKIGISAGRIRLYFIYTSCLTLGSPIVFYLFAAFWLNIKKYIFEKRTSVWDL